MTPATEGEPERWIHNATFAGPEDLDAAIDALEEAGYDFFSAGSQREADAPDDSMDPRSDVPPAEDRLRAAIQRHRIDGNNRALWDSLSAVPPAEEKRATVRCTRCRDKGLIEIPCPDCEGLKDREGESVEVEEIGSHEAAMKEAWVDREGDDGELRAALTELATAAAVIGGRFDTETERDPDSPWVAFSLALGNAYKALTPPGQRL